MTWVSAVVTALGPVWYFATGRGRLQRATAAEIARQIRLRNLGGLIIMDFIDMKERRHRHAVYEKMVEMMATDKEKNHILPIASLGVIKINHQHHREQIPSKLYQACPYCHGRATVPSATRMS